MTAKKFANFIKDGEGALSLSGKKEGAMQRRIFRYALTGFSFHIAKETSIFAIAILEYSSFERYSSRFISQKKICRTKNGILLKKHVGFTKKNPRSYFSADLAFFTHKKEFGLSAIKGARDGIGRNGKRLEAFRGARESKSFLSP